MPGMDHLARAALSAAPATPAEAHALLADVATLIARVRAHAMSSQKPLELPPGVVGPLHTAHEAIKEAMRAMEASFT